jgi:hypothetical protein
MFLAGIVSLLAGDAICEIGGTSRSSMRIV